MCTVSYPCSIGVCLILRISVSPSHVFHSLVYKRSNSGRHGHSGNRSFLDHKGRVKALGLQKLVFLAGDLKMQKVRGTRLC